MRRCASRKKSRESISSAAWLNASLWIRIAPSTDFSASRLCGRVRSGAAATVSGMSGEMNVTSRRRAAHAEKKGVAASTRRTPSVVRPCGRSDGLRYDFHAELGRHVAMNLHGDGRLAERLERVGQRDLALVDVETAILQRLRDVLRGHRT